MRKNETPWWAKKALGVASCLLDRLGGSGPVNVDAGDDPELFPVAGGGFAPPSGMLRAGGFVPNEEETQALNLPWLLNLGPDAALWAKQQLLARRRYLKSQSRESFPAAEWLEANRRSTVTLRAQLGARDF